MIIHKMRLNNVAKLNNNIIIIITKYAHSYYTNTGRI